MKYCNANHQSQRFLTREVNVGGVGVGGRNPIRIQSMTTTPTDDVEATVNQIIQLYEAGCEIARVTVQGYKEAKACEAIKSRLIQKGCPIPLVSDIHFFPKAAMTVVEYVDKVRINPGNFADRRATFQQKSYSDTEYADELKRIEDVFAPLVLRCKELGKPIRIGTNHGSLSDRIMNQFGDSPLGMVESAVEYLRICQKYDFHDVIFSMKASNTLVMIQAYRLLVATMIKNGWDYPLHLGVTEAGEGVDGRVKSALGTGSLLLEGLGDTIRVSLTENPVKEIKPCKELIKMAEQYQGRGVEPFEERHRDFMDLFAYQDKNLKLKHMFKQVYLGLEITNQQDIQALEDGTIELDDVDLIITENSNIHSSHINSYFVEIEGANDPFQVSPMQEKGLKVLHVTDNDTASWNRIKNTPSDLICFSSHKPLLFAVRQFVDFLREEGIDRPLIVKARYDMSFDQVQYKAAAEIGGVLADQLCQGLLLNFSGTLAERYNLSRQILQASRKKMYKTEYISCPGCGRTLFELEEVTKKIQKKTSHLKGVKIAIMGCIVNGPGEMADADFGYVGSKAGMIDLYVGKSCVERNIPFAEADEKLINLIKEHKMWHDPVEEAMQVK